MSTIIWIHFADRNILKSLGGVLRLCNTFSFDAAASTRSEKRSANSDRTSPASRNYHIVIVLLVLTKKKHSSSSNQQERTSCCCSYLGQLSTFFWAESSALEGENVLMMHEDFMNDEEDIEHVVGSVDNFSHCTTIILDSKTGRQTEFSDFRGVCVWRGKSHLNNPPWDWQQAPLASHDRRALFSPNPYPGPNKFENRARHCSAFLSLPVWITVM